LGRIIVVLAEDVGRTLHPGLSVQMKVQLLAQLPLALLEVCGELKLLAGGEVWGHGNLLGDAMLGLRWRSQLTPVKPVAELQKRRSPRAAGIL
jgi:hypothetical protein